jgi:hypothetical protein
VAGIRPPHTPKIGNSFNLREVLRIKTTTLLAINKVQPIDDTLKNPAQYERDL